MSEQAVESCELGLSVCSAAHAASLRKDSVSFRKDAIEITALICDYHRLKE